MLLHGRIGMLRAAVLIIVFISAVDVAAGDDCNGNGIVDSSDIASGTSLDLDTNGVPDECQPDCNNNGIPDALDIASGTSEDCNTNGLPDTCDIGILLAHSVDSGVPPWEELILAIVTSDSGVPPYEELMLVEEMYDSGVPPWEELMLELADVDADLPPYAEVMTMPDECATTAGSSSDCNLDGIPDACEVASSLSADTNSNEIPDECEDAPPVLTNAVSQKVHGTGFGAVTRSIAAGGVECRSGGITKIKLSFDKSTKASDGSNLTASDFELSRGTITNVSSLWLFQPPGSGSVTLTISGVDTPGPFSIAFTAENAVGVEANYEVCWTYVPGDVDADGDVDNNDESAMLGVYQLPRGSSTFRYDLDLDNVVEASVGENDYEILDGVNPTSQQTLCGI